MNSLQDVFGIICPLPQMPRSQTSMLEQHRRAVCVAITLCSYSHKLSLGPHPPSEDNQRDGDDDNAGNADQDPKRSSVAPRDACTHISGREVAGHLQKGLPARRAATHARVATEPRKCTVSRRSKSSLRTPPFDSPAGFAIAASLDPG